MAIDEAISVACGEGKSPTTLRLYGWKSPVISIGYSQKIETDINLPYCNSTGIEIVKRPTGGRAVLHENELTFSLNSSNDNHLFSKNILKSHKKISEALLVGIKRLGIDAELHCRSRKKTTRNPICFSAPSMYELVAGGKKIIGCAQRRYKNSFLEHGSIPLKLDRNKLFSVFKNDPSPDSDLPDNMAGLNELGSRNFSLDQVAESIIEGFKQYFDITFTEENLSEYEVILLTEKHN